MSIRSEQYRALKKSRDFLRELMQVRVKDIRKKWLVDKAYSCLKHFPALWDSGQPIWNRDEFTEDVEERCNWNYDGREDRWNTSCRNGFQFVNCIPEDDQFKCCPYCGKLIEVGNDD